MPGHWAIGERASLTLAAALLLASSCKPQPVVIHVPFPVGYAAALLAVTSNHHTELYAETSKPDGPLLRSFSDLAEAAPIDITAFFYDRSLQDLRLETGRQPETDYPKPRTRPIPPFSSSVRTVVAGPTAPTFETIRSLDDPALDAAVRGWKLPTACRPMSIRRFADDTLALIRPVHAFAPSRTSTVMAYKEPSAITPPAYYALDEQGPHPFSSPLPNLRPKIAIETRSRQVVMLDQDGVTLVIGTFGGTFERVPPPPSPLKTVDVSFSDQEAEAVLYGLDANDKIERFDGSQWSIIGDASNWASQTVAFAWRAPGEVEIATHQKLVAIRSSGATEELTPPPVHGDADFFSFLRFVPGFGLVAGTGEFALFALKGDEWTTIQEGEYLLSHGVTVAASFGGSLVIGGDLGYLRPFFGEPCEKINLSINSTLTALEPIGDGHTFAGTILDADSLTGAVHGFAFILEEQAGP